MNLKILGIVTLVLLVAIGIFYLSIEMTGLQSFVVNEEIEGTLEFKELPCVEMPCAGVEGIALVTNTETYYLVDLSSNFVLDMSTLNIYGDFDLNENVIVVGEMSLISDVEGELHSTILVNNIR